MTRNLNQNTSLRQGGHVTGQNQMIKREKRHVIDDVLIQEIIKIHLENRRNQKRIDHVIENDPDLVIVDRARGIDTIVTVTIVLIVIVDMIAIVIIEQTKSDDRRLIQKGGEDHVIEQGRVTEKLLQDLEVGIVDREVDRKRNQKSRERNRKKRNILIITMNSKIFIKRKLKGTLFYNKVGCVSRLSLYYKAHAEFGPTHHQDGAFYFILKVLSW